MNIFRRTDKMVLETSLRIPHVVVKEQGLSVKDIINHLLKHESKLVKADPLNMQLLEVCVGELLPVQDESITIDYHLANNRNINIKTMFHPATKLVKVYLHDRDRKDIHLIRNMSKCELEEGYDLHPVHWAHSAVTIKVERDTDSSNLTTWAVVG